MASRNDRILLTGFGPFGAISRNPSGEIAAALNGLELEGGRVHSVVLPVVRARALPEALEAVQRFGPQAVVALGLASARDAINVEETARNLDDFEATDEEGEHVHATPIVPGGPAELAATLPTEEILGAIRAADVPAVASQDAGAFLCNHIYYGLLREAAGRPRESGFRCVFLHLPGVPECARAADGQLRPSLPLAQTRRGVVAALGRVAALLAGAG